MTDAKRALHEVKAADRPETGGVVSLDPVWEEVRREAQAIVSNDVTLRDFIEFNLLAHETLEEAVIHRIAERLHRTEFSADKIREAYRDFIADEPQWTDVMRVDIAVVYERDPACTRLIEPILYFKGFHALQTHRLAHWAWNAGRRDLALYLQSISSQTFQTDINPAAPFGKGVFLDHATGLVVGATARVGDNVSIMQDVTLGGTGKEDGDRHPKIGCGVLIGAGARVLGNIEVGDCARVAAGSLVIKPVPEKATVAGVPAKVVGLADCAQPARSMNQIIADIENNERA